MEPASWAPSSISLSIRECSSARLAWGQTGELLRVLGGVANSDVIFSDVANMN